MAAGCARTWRVVRRWPQICHALLVPTLSRKKRFMPQLSRRIGPKFQVLLAFANTIIGLILLSLLPATPVLAIPAVKSVKIIGTNLAVNLATQEGQPYDARAIDKDVHQLW